MIQVNPYKNSGLEVKVTVAPSQGDRDTFLSINAIKNYLKLQYGIDSLEDALLADLYSRSLDLVQRNTAVAILPQTRIAYWATFGSEVKIPYGPITDLTTVESIYDGTPTTLTEGTSFTVTGLDFKTLHLDMVYNTGGGYYKRSLQVTYDCGYAADSVPEAFKVAILQQIADDYEYRTSVDEQGLKGLSRSTKGKLIGLTKRTRIA